MSKENIELLKAEFAAIATEAGVSPERLLKMQTSSSMESNVLPSKGTFEGMKISGKDKFMHARIIADNNDTASFSCLQISAHLGKIEDVKFIVAGAAAKNPGAIMLKGKPLNTALSGNQDELYAKIKGRKFQSKAVEVVVLPPKFNEKGEYVPYATEAEALAALTIKEAYKITLLDE